MKLVVNADDFGLNSKINNGIIEAYKKGILTSTTILVNGQNFLEAIELQKEVGISVGLHFNLTEGKSLTKNKTLSDEDGTFFLSNLANKKISKEEIKLELEAQYEKLQKNIEDITHIDCHHHVHTNRIVREVLIEFCKKNDLYMRRSERRKLVSFFQRIGNYNKYFLNFSIKVISNLGSKKIKNLTPFNFYGRFYDKNISEKLFLKILENNKNSKLLEVMCHPGYFFKGDKYSKREAELKVLQSPILKKWIVKNQIKLIDYKGMSKR